MPEFMHGQHLLHKLLSK